MRNREYEHYGYSLRQVKPFGECTLSEDCGRERPISQSRSTWDTAAQFDFEAHLPELSLTVPGTIRQAARLRWANVLQSLPTRCSYTRRGIGQTHLNCRRLAMR